MQLLQGRESESINNFPGVREWGVIDRKATAEGAALRALDALSPSGRRFGEANYARVSNLKLRPVAQIAGA